MPRTTKAELERQLAVVRLANDNLVLEAKADHAALVTHEQRIAMLEGRLSAMLGEVQGLENAIRILVRNVGIDVNVRNRSSGLRGISINEIKANV